MDEFCGSAFWDSRAVWDTDDPDLTLCFEKTILVWVPCTFLWILSPLEIYHICRSKTSHIPFSFYNIAKLIAIIISAVVALTDIVLYVIFHFSHSPVDFYSPLVKFVTLILFFGLTYANVKFGRRSSAVLFFFSLLLALLGAPQCRTEFRLKWFKQGQFATMQFCSYVIYYISIVVVFVLNCFADSYPRILPRPFDKNECPRNQSSFLSQILFAWFEPLLWKGYRKSLDDEDLWNLDPSISTACVVPKFEKQLKKSLRKVKKNADFSIKAKRKSGRCSFDGLQYKIKNEPASVVPALCRTFGSTFLKGTLLKIFLDIFVFVNPQILSLLIDFVGSEEPMWKGYLYVASLFLAAVIQTLLSAQYQDIMYTIGIKIRTCLISVIYKKALHISNVARRDFTTGEIVNLMSVDANRFVELPSYSYLFISTPLQTVLALYFLWQILGPSVLASLVVVIISILINSYIGSQKKLLQSEQMKKKDSRIKLMNQILNGIKMLKLYAWEPSFEEQVSSIRNDEMKILKKQAYLTGISTFTWDTTSFLVYVVSFAVYVLSDEKNVLDARVVFVSLALFSILKMPLFSISSMISNLVQSNVSVKRIDKFLNCEELSSDDVTHDDRPEVLVMEHGAFSWAGSEALPILRDINVKINAGDLVAVVGPIGSGKSSLLSAFLGEMYKLSGVVNTKGTIAYVPQEAWILNSTVKDNITFGETVKGQLYDKVLEACALKPDLKTFSGGDLTEIGVKGINLSGGQKQRLSLARAVHYGADVYLLDDPLSAVDSQVGKHVFERVIGPNGLLKNKTRVMVTHGVTHLSKVDFIIVIKDGTISECGTFQELLDSKGDFSEFLITYLEENLESDEEELGELKDILVKKKETYDNYIRQMSIDCGTDIAAFEMKRKSVWSVNSNTRESFRKRSTKQGNEIAAIGQKLIEVEHTEMGNSSRDVYTYYIRATGYLMICGIIFSNCFLQVFSFASSMWLIEWTSDPNITTSDGIQNTSKTDFYLWIYISLGFSKSVTEFLADVAIRVGCCISAKVLHNSLLHNFLRLPLSFMDVTPSGRILSRFSSDIDVVDGSFPDLLSEVFFCNGDLICNLFIISCCTPIFVTVILPITVLYCLVQRFYVATSRQLKRLESISRSPMYSHFVETVVGAQSIRSYGLTEKFIKQSQEKLDHNHRSYYLNLISNRWLSVRAESISNLILFFAALFSVLERDSISAGIVGLSVGYTFQITQTLSWSIFKISNTETSIVSVERIKEYSEKPQEAAWNVPNESMPKNWPLKGDIDFLDFKVRYREGLELVLKGITFSVRDGQKVGIVGRTGAGKSSLSLSLFRILESAGGKILIDGIDIATLGLHTLRSRLTIIPQDSVLFAGSLRMNLDPFGDHSDDEIWRALELAHLKSYISSLNDALRFEIAEGGENVSGGQRQLICLARALLRKTKILILDEATAVVDLETDDLIQNTIRNEFVDCTVLTIAHRLNTIMDYDKIIVLDRGYLVEYDSPEALLQKKTSIFYAMAVDAGLV
ncbi:multidrug resistance-associated protein 1-like isoform X2 [Planococcus citri]|uniref:multidrug resistance-associated protein 1-like isoform X2 n=1 Tax=Planococcus citri TaxID=170843 RepID=UPI0031F7CB60